MKSDEEIENVLRAIEAMPDSDRGNDPLSLVDLALLQVELLLDIRRVLRDQEFG